MTRRIPVKVERTFGFGTSTVSSLAVLRVFMSSEGITGVGDVPLNLGWCWPGANGTAQASIDEAAQKASQRWLAEGAAWVHPLELGTRAAHRLGEDSIPQLCAVVVNAAFDAAAYDLYGKLLNLPSYESLSADGARVAADNLPGEILEETLHELGRPGDPLMRAWHLVSLTDPLDGEDGLAAWIDRDGIKALKIKVDGRDLHTTLDRLGAIHDIGLSRGIIDYCLDFNGTATGPAEFEEFLVELTRSLPGLHDRLTFIEQPFAPGRHSPGPHNFRSSIPLFVDEGAADQKGLVAAFADGWDGAVLKTCKGLTSSILMLATCRAAGKPYAVMDLSNPMLAQLAHLGFAARSGSGYPVESNGVQFYPRASEPEAEIHPGCFRRTNGTVSVESLSGPGLGYAGAEFARGDHEVVPR